MSITRINEFCAAAGAAENLFSFLQSLVPYISAAEGCISCELMRALEHDDQFVVIEKWESIAAHKQSIAHFPKEQMQAAMPLFGAAPKGAYYLG